MSNLEKQLRELGKDEFESFVQQYLVARYPGAEIKRVEGTGGDAGIDSFQGQLGSGPAIWQSKHFSGRIKEPQRRQILKSIKTALKSSPTLWILCVPINLRTPEHKWFEEKIVNVYGGPERVKLIQATDFATELLHNRDLRDTFFPDNAVSNIREITRAITKTEGRTQEDMGLLTTEYAQQYLESQIESEPRLQAVISFGGSPQMRQLQRQPGLVMSITEAERTINYFARDIKAFNLDPIKIDIRLPREQGAALSAAIDAGRQHKIQAGNILQLQTSSPLLKSLFEKAELSHVELEMIPCVPAEIAAQDMPLRFIAGSGQSAKVLPYIPFRVIRTGRREIALVSQGRLPVEISLTLRLSAEEGATFNLRPVLIGADVQKLNEVIEFMDELERSSQLRVDSVDTGAPLLTASGVGIRSELDIPQGLKDTISDAALVAAIFNTPLRLPDRISRDDKDDLEMLKRIASGEEFFDVKLDAVLTKSTEHQKNVLNSLNQARFEMRVDHPAGWRSFSVFGETIEPGPITFISQETTFLDVENTRSAYLAAEEGDGVPVRAHCAGPCQFTRNSLNPYSVS